MKFLLDENISPEVALILRNQRIDSVSIHDIALMGASDKEVLEYAAGEERCVVTKNRDDFRILTERFFAEGRNHAGVLVVSRSLHISSLLANALLIYAQTHTDSVYPFLFDFIVSQGESNAPLCAPGD